MKNLWFIGFLILSFTFISCSEKGKEETKLNQTKEGLVKETDSKAPVREKENIGNKNIEKQKDAAFEEKIQNGEIIMLTRNGEPEPFNFVGSKITAMKLPDGELHQVIEKGDRTMIKIPGKGEMGIIMLNKKFYLFDDNDQAYEVKFIHNQLFAEKTDLTDVLVKK